MVTPLPVAPPPPPPPPPPLPPVCPILPVHAAPEGQQAISLASSTVQMALVLQHAVGTP